jgi:hypothetical protein
MRHPTPSADFQKLPEHWRRQWWFFDPQHAKATTDAAFKLELVRRNDTYRQISRAIGPRTGRQKKGNAERGLGVLPPAALQSPLLPLFIWKRCSPSLRWIDLTPGQRRGIEQSEELLPELNAPQAIGNKVTIGLAEISNDISNRRIAVTPLWATGHPLTIAGFPESLVAEKIPNGKWIVIAFDARLSSDRLAKQFDETVSGPDGLDIAAKCKAGHFQNSCAKSQACSKNCEEPKRRGLKRFGRN